LIGGQAAASVVLLVAAALLTRAAIHVSRIDPGFDVDRLVQVSVGLRGGYDQARIDTYWSTALDRVRTLPGVAAAALTDSQPFSVYGPQRWQGDVIGYREASSAEYFSTIALAVRGGRVFTVHEVRDQASVAVISESVARMYWGRESPIGYDLERVWGPPDGPGSSRGSMRKPPGTRIVGVVADTITDIGTGYAPTVYLPSESLHANTKLVVRSIGDPADAIAPVRDVLLSIDPEQRPGFYLLRDRFQRQLDPPKRLAMLSAIVSAAALGLATIGLFGVAAFVAGQRRREVGIRMALGARPQDVVRLLIRDSLQPVVIGLATGVVVALWVGRWLRGAMYGLGARDPFALAAGVVVLLAAALAATYWPARRAARVDPAIVLRSDG
jgi:predicted permease